MTNRDKFNGINNDVLADMLCVINGGVECKFCAYEEGSCLGKSCFDGIKRRLNFMTNRDEFDQMSNSELADILKRAFVGDRCKFCRYTSGDCFGKNCVEGIERWLNDTCANEPENPPADKHVDLHKVADEVTRDNVNHPDHYNHGKIEVIDFIEDKELGFHLGNAVKYISRAGRKDANKTIEDLRKAAWYLNRQIERLERGGNE